MELITVKHPTIKGEKMLVDRNTAERDKLQIIEDEPPIETGGNIAAIAKPFDSRTKPAINAENRQTLYENPDAKIPETLERLEPVNNTAGMTKSAVMALIEEATGNTELEAIDHDLPLNHETEGEITKGRESEQTPSAANPLATKKSLTSFRGTKQSTQEENSKESM